MRHRIAAAASSILLVLAALPAAAIDIHRVWHDGREIDLVERDGWAVYDGDILVGRFDEVLERSRREGPDGARIGTLLAKSSTVGSACCRWPRGPGGELEVPYVVETDPDNNVPGAIALFNQQLAGFMRAVARTTQSDYVAFTLSASDNSNSCSSSIGRVGGRQVIQGSHSCGAAVLVHELGHAIGLFHEQEHVDAAAYVRIDAANVDPARVHNYEPSTNRRRATPYDFASIMHYGTGGFSRDGRPTMETIPPGIAVGQRTGFSAADIEGIRRLYGDPPQQVTIASFPPGMTVVVDGVNVVTPAVFNWGMGSTHVLDVPPAAQVAAGAAHVFARWNVDTAGDMAARRTITVAAGDGSITAPASRPAISTYTASFVRYKEVRLTTSSNRAGVGGSVIATPQPSTLFGVGGVYYRERQEFALEPVPIGSARLGSWNGSYFFMSAYTTPYSATFHGPLAFSDTLQSAYEYRGYFVDFPFLTLRARAQDGDVLGISASVTRGTATSGTATRLPYNTVNWSAGETATVAMDTVQSPFPLTMRYVFRDWDGNPSPTVSVAAPQLGDTPRTMTANFSKEYQAYRQVIPSCAGTISLPGEASAWYAHGSNVSASLAMSPGWVMTGWEGSLSGGSTLGAFTVTTHPQVIARLNTVAAPLTVGAVAPASVAPGQAVTLDIQGTGFTELSEVYVAGLRQASQYVGPTRLTASVPAAALPSAGLAIVTVANRPAGSTSCAVSATGSIDILGTATAEVQPQTGWWWNAAEAGRGFFIEKRGSNVFMAGYLYEADGRATWFSAAGPVSGNTFSADMVTYRGGQTLTGNYVPPANGPTLGRVTLVFNSATSATLTWPAGTTALTRFSFGSGGAGLPENGWWWNAAESGRGYSIEIQGSAIFMAGFMYDVSGNPVWYYAQGSVDSSNRFASAWIQNANGQTLTGGYRAPVTLNSNVGSLTLAFSGSRSAALTLPNGRQVTLTRFEF